MIEMGATAFDLAHTIHPHPTLNETLMECAAAFYSATQMLCGSLRGRIVNKEVVA
jgi:hypothetical protein